MRREILILAFLLAIISGNLWGQNIADDSKSFPDAKLGFNIRQIAGLSYINNRIFHKQIQFAQIELTINKTFSKSTSRLFNIDREPTSIITENFEYTFPSPERPWNVFDDDSTAFGEYFWGAVDSFYHLTPTHSAWCAAAGQSANHNSRIYPNNCNSWMVCGPLDFSNANWAAVKFSVWLDSQLGHDYLFWMVSTDSSHFNGYGLSGNTDRWLRLNFNLTHNPELGKITGSHEVWIAFMFFSDDDSAEAYEGAYLDDISIEAANLDTFNTVKFQLNTSDATGLTWDGSHFWCADNGTKQIYKLEIDKSVIKCDSIFAPVSNPADLTWDGSYFWNVDTSGEIVKFDNDGSKIGNSIQLIDKTPYGLTWDGSYLWISDYFNQNLYKLYPFNQWLESTPLLADTTSRFTGLAWDNQFLWLADEANSIIYQLDQSGTIHDYYLSPAPKPRGLTFDAQNLWCIASNSIYQLETILNEGLLVKVLDHDKNRFPEISASVSVRRNNENKFLRNLSKQHFSVFENNYDQSPFTISPPTGNQLIRFSLVLDYSGSMSDQNIRDMNQASHKFVDLMEPDSDSGAVIKFASLVDTFQTLTGDTALLHQAIRDTNTHYLLDGTALYDAIFGGLEQVKNGNENDQKAIVVMTDGIDRSSIKKKKRDIIKYAVEHKVEIFTIGLGDSISEVILRDISDSTGGQCYLASSTSQLDSICKDVFQDLTRYRISYYSNRPIFDGSLRQVAISVNFNSETGSDTFQYVAPLKDTIDIWFDSLLVHSNDIVKIPIKTEDITNRGVYGVFLSISYNNVVLTPIDITRGIVPLESISMKIDTLQGQIILAVACTHPLVGADSLMNIVFHVKGTPGQSSILHFENAYFNEGNPYVKTADGYLKVDDSITLSGRIGYYPKFADSTVIAFDSLFNSAKDFNTLFDDSVKKFVSNVQLGLRNNLSHFNTITDSIGFYLFEKLARENLSLTVFKGNNLNNAITPYDASLVLQHIIGLKPFSPYQKIAADVTGNGSLSPLDASYILRVCTGDTNKFPVAADWTFVPHDSIITSTNWHRISRFRSYHPLDRSLDNQNFFAVVYGDVSGNWTQTTNLLAKNEINDFLISHLEVNDPIEITENQGVLAIAVKDVSDIYSFGLSIKFDCRQLKIKTVSPTEQARDFSLIYHDDGICLHVAAAGAKPINGNGSLINIEFELSNATIALDMNSMSIISFSLNEFEAIDLNKEISLNTAVALPTEYAISQNYPNPFNLQTMIKYQLPEIAQVKIEIYNLLGQRVRTLINGEIKAGYHQVNWDGQDDLKNNVASGVYIRRFQANQFVSNRKMVILK